jgi:hypothetical protein
LKHTRHLKIEDGLEDYTHAEHGEALAHLLQSFSMDSLRTLELDTHESVPLEITLLIHSRQRELLNIVSHHQARPSEINPWFQMQSLLKITRVSLFLRSVEDCERAEYVLQHTPALRDLEVVMSSDDIHEHDTVESIFTPWFNGRSDDQKIRLRKLAFYSYDFAMVFSELVRMIDFAALSTLIFAGCYDTDVILQAIGSCETKIETFIDDKCQYTEIDDEAVHGNFIRGVRGLRQLWLGRVGIDPLRCSWTDLSTHGKTLRSLVVDDYRPHIARPGPFEVAGLGRSYDEFEKLCECCQSLEQLAIQPPSYDHPDFTRFMTCLSRLQKLTSLRLLTYSDSPESSLKYETQEMADQVFSALWHNCPCFKALLIEARSGDQDCDSRQEPTKFGYLRESRFSPIGQMRAGACPIKPHLLKHYEPCSWIFGDRAEA